MLDIEKMVQEQLRTGLHCSQVMMQLSLQLRDREEPFTVRALGALGGGMFSQRCCGTLTGGVAAISSYFPRQPGEPEPEGYKKPAQALVEWFEAEYGSLDCKDLLAAEGRKVMDFCPMLMARCFEKTLEILEENGVDPYA